MGLLQATVIFGQAPGACEAPFRRAVGFVEKPSLPQAQSLVKEGCLWNSGIFLARWDVFSRLFERQLPELWKAVLSVKRDLSNLEPVYRGLENLSFDKGIMEKIHSFICLPVEWGWRDLGSWGPVADHALKHPKTLNDKFIARHDSRGNFIFSSTGPAEFRLADLENHLFAQAEQGILVSSKEQSGAVKAVGFSGGSFEPKSPRAFHKTGGATENKVFSGPSKESIGRTGPQTVKVTEDKAEINLNEQSSKSAAFMETKRKESGGKDINFSIKKDSALDCALGVLSGS